MFMCPFYNRETFMDLSVKFSIFLDHYLLEMIKFDIFNFKKNLWFRFR
jgi:hypothetical protein